MARDVVVPPQTRICINSRERAWGVQCRYVKRDGTRCGRWAIRGHYVCPKHGGSLPVVRAAAKANLEALAPVAVGQLGRLVREAEDATQLRAIKYLLSLVGITASGARRPGTRLGERAARALDSGVPDSDLDEIDSQIAELLARRALGAGGTPGG